METISYFPQPFDIMASSEHHDFLKLEDLHSSSSPASFVDDSAQSISQTSPPPVIVQSKPAKKRKSWGQELPEPKTALPPRKRAKTDDEKEQRRIERIKRNRAAAHNSRERKRQETETLAVALARANAELDAYRRLHGPLPSSVVLPEVTLSTDDVDTPAPSLIESRGSIDDATSPASPEETLFDYNVNIKQEPSNDVTFPSTIPPAYETLDAKSSLPLDQTQHSAAMLCDLQCRSSRNSDDNSNNNTNTASSITTTFWWANLFLCLMTLQLQSYYKTTLLALWSHSPSRMARLMQASTHRSTSRSTTSSMTPLPSRLTMALAQRNAATGMATTRQGAQALQRSSLIEARRTSEVGAAAEQQQHHNIAIDTKALEEHWKREQDKGTGDGGV